MDIKVVVAAHKSYTMPDDEIYLPLHVGAEDKESIGFTRDDSGDNISKKNPHFCELTGLYWTWKNLKCDYLGLAHYRRHFGEKKGRQILTCNTAKELFRTTDIILPKKRKYYIENLYDHYIHTLCREPLDITGEIIKEKYPQSVHHMIKINSIIGIASYFGSLAGFGTLVGLIYPIFGYIGIIVLFFIVYSFVEVKRNSAATK